MESEQGEIKSEGKRKWSDRKTKKERERENERKREKERGQIKRNMRQEQTTNQMPNDIKIDRFCIHSMSICIVLFLFFI